MAVDTKYPHKVLTELFSSVEDMTKRTKWCIEIFGSSNNGVWYETLVECTFRSQGEVMPEFKEIPFKTQCFFFKDETDAIAFKLRWDGYYNYANNPL